ncbi:kinesin-like protein KIF22-like [Planoprotostelium fungivorum]|uniref:Kinesin-like protein n=1 Tax=Planoprotostelium fungivorum TaxID=1890364 RepID=A0A2P6NLF5_9EUKA|nr:kinesin-like protein KIF22-like [Planoprotostelium fungivorum]
MKCTNTVCNPVRTAIRIRPFITYSRGGFCVSVEGEKGVRLINPFVNKEATDFEMYASFGSDASQDDVFSKEVASLLPELFQGTNITILAYGTTESGKTYTMQGTTVSSRGSSENLGIIPRAVTQILERKTRNTSLSVSYMEIYNEKVYDLLQTRTSQIELVVREDVSQNIFIDGLQELPIRNIKEFNEIYKIGHKNRKSNASKIDSRSSRSHATLTVKVQRKIEGQLLSSQLVLVDLAGSEAAIHMTESADINRSLFTLRRVLSPLNGDISNSKVITALNRPGTRVPYGDSTLTRILRDSLGGNSLSLLIAHVSQDIKHYVDTLNTLNFAARSKRLIEPNFDAVKLFDEHRCREGLEERQLFHEMHFSNLLVYARAVVRMVKRDQQAEALPERSTTPTHPTSTPPSLGSKRVMHIYNAVDDSPPKD